jgi:hypothetical protein
MAKKKSRHKWSPTNTTLAVVAVAIAFILTLIRVSGDSMPDAKGPKTQTSRLPDQVYVTTPNGGESFRQGQQNTISWKGGYRRVAIGLATADSDTEHRIALSNTYPEYEGPQKDGYTGKLLGFINTRENAGVHVPDSSFVWDGMKVCNFHLNLDPDKWCENVVPGKYKMFVWSESIELQSMCIATGFGPSGAYNSNVTKDSGGCNWDLSDQPFTITTP